MRYCVALAGLVLIPVVSIAQTMTITGTVRDLTGDPLAALENLSVRAFVGGNPIATGSVTPASPFVYTIRINANDVNANDVRVLLSFRADGQTPVDLNQVVGKAAEKNAAGQMLSQDGRQVIDIVMPKADCPYPYLYPCEKRWRLFRLLRN